MGLVEGSIAWPRTCLSTHKIIISTGHEHQELHFTVILAMDLVSKVLIINVSLLETG